MTWKTDEGTATYEGEWENDVKHGTGIYKWPGSDAYYDGGWV